MINREELEKRARVYFDKGEKEIYATEDGNFFYSHSKSFAEAHSKQNKVKLHHLEKTPKKVETKTKDEEKVQSKQTKKVE